MTDNQVLTEITAFCKRHGIAESTFGRLAVNDGKLVKRLHHGARMNSRTLGRVYEFMNEVSTGQRTIRGRSKRKHAVSRRQTLRSVRKQESPVRPSSAFTYYEDRQKYHLLVNTCNEKWVLADKAFESMKDMEPSPPSFNIFDASLGNGTVLNRILRAMHKHHPSLPFLVVAKERGLDDLRNSLGKLVDRFCEHPLMILIITNMHFNDAVNPSQCPDTPDQPMNWQEVPLQGNTGYDFQKQISALHKELAEDWRLVEKEDSKPEYISPCAWILYRSDQRYVLDSLIPKQGEEFPNFNFIIAAHVFRHAATMEFKIRNVLKPLVERLAPDGKLMFVQSHGNDPGYEIVRNVWGSNSPKTVSRHVILKALKEELGDSGRKFSYSGITDRVSLFRFDMHTLPIDPSSEIGTSTLLAAWNDVIYVYQVPQDMIDEVMASGREYLNATAKVIENYGGLWFINESFIVERQNKDRGTGTGLDGQKS